MRRVFIIMALALMGLAGQAQRDIDMNVVRKAMKQQHAMTTRNDIAPIKATYSVSISGSMWEYRDDFVYDEWDYFLTQKNTNVKNNGEWQPFMQTNYEVDWNYCPIEVITMKWNGSTWMNDTRITCEYDEIGYVPVIKEEVHEQWGDHNWVNVNKYIYDYDPLVTVIVKDWNGNTWENHYLYTIEEGLNETTILLQYWQGGAWQNQERTILTLNAQGKEETLTITEWQNATWVNEEQHTYEYDANGYLSKVFKRGWENGNWSNTNYQTLNYTSDGMGNSIEAFCRISGNAAPNTDLTLYYNEGESIDYKNVNRINMEYIDLTAVHETEATSRFSVYPNPAVGMLEVRGEGFVKAEVYNLAGQQVMATESRIIDVSGMTSGAYLMKVYTTDNKMDIQKILVK